MIDTVLLKIPQHHFSVFRPELFQPNANGIFFPPYITFAGQKFVKCVQNPSKQDTNFGIYKPRLTLYKRLAKGGFAISLHIELSIPKLVFGNNFDEVTENDFDHIIDALQQQLLTMGVRIDRHNLEEAPVYDAHYGKNIVFDDFTTVSLVLSQLSKIKLHSRYDLNRTEYQNGGDLLRYHTDQFSLVFYDKIADLKKSKNRAAEKKDRGINLQLNLFEELQKHKPYEVLRMEVRFKGRRKLAKVIGISPEQLTLRKVLNQNTAQNILLSYWNNIYYELQTVLLQELSPSEYLEYIARQQPGNKPQKTLAMLGLITLIKSAGYRPARKTFKQFYSQRTFDRFNKDIQKLSFNIQNRSVPFANISKALESFQPLRMSNFKLN